MKTKRAMISVIGHEVNEDGVLDELEDRIVEVPANSYVWTTVHDGWEVEFASVGCVQFTDGKGMEVYGPMGRRRAPAWHAKTRLSGRALGMRL